MSARRVWAWPLVPLYAAGLAVKDGLRAVGVLKVKRLAWPVVSVGSLSAGGAGKTPVVIALAELLRGSGWGLDVLSRGYGREGAGVERVDAQAEGAATRFGDEPVLIARRTGVPVWVGAERFRAGVAAEGIWQAQGPGLKPPTFEPDYRGLKPAATPEGKTRVPAATPEGQASGLNDSVRGVHLLDDGFQHRRLARTVDVVVVTAADLEDALLPVGNRREGLKALWRADVVVVREEEREQVEVRLRGRLREGTPVWTVRRELRFAGPVGAMSAGSRPVAFCAIARPDGFWAMLAQTGCEVVETVAFGDHHAYGAEDVERLVTIAGERGATGFLTTEKDAVKLSLQMMERLQRVGPVCVVELDATFVDEGEVVRDLEGRIG